MRTRDTRLTVTLYTRTGRGEVTQSEERERENEKEQRGSSVFMVYNKLCVSKEQDYL